MNVPRELKKSDKIDRATFDSLKKLPFFKGRVVTGSMVPVIKIGDSILVEIGSTDIKRFDIIVFYQNGILVCHYLWSSNKFVKPILYQTRSLIGGVDFPIEHSDYLGKVLSHRLSFWRILKVLFRDLTRQVLSR